MAKLEYFGHSMWRIVASGFSIVIDPFDNIGYPMPENLTAQYVIISHEHHDHNNIALVKGNPEVIRTSGLHQNKDFTAELISVFHDNISGTQRGKNNLIKLQIDGLTLVHCGDLGHLPSEEIRLKVDKPDLLLIPVGEVYTLALTEAWKFIKAIQPKLILPMHYSTENLGFKLGKLDNFIRNSEHVIYHDSNTLELTPAVLSQPGTIILNWAKKE